MQQEASCPSAIYFLALTRKPNEIVYIAWKVEFKETPIKV